MAYFDAQNRRLINSVGASYAVETKFTDSLRAVETWYFAPKKVREVASFSNIRRRIRDGETVVYYDNGSVKRRESYQDGARQGEGLAYYSNGKIRRRDRYENQKRVLQECFDESGGAMNCDTLDRRACPNQVPFTQQTTNVRYPAKALKLGIEGVVKVKFVVNRTGQLVDVWVVESPSPLLDVEAIAAVRRIKQWRVGLIDCDPMDTFYTLPLTFKIN
ncbi:TonB family protein [Hymenobacter qilianensis]|nr:energy transducer TonB [Hymenobacter qilianensis]QNP51587.1 TonB family protein [Hymenobacter qilianensis]